VRKLVIPLFSSSASRKQGGIFTVEKAGSLAKSGRKHGPVSLCDLAKEEGLKKLHLVDANMVSFFSAFKNLKEVGCDLVFGLKVVVCENMTDKSEASLKTESKVIIWMAGNGGADYKALCDLYSLAAQDGFYYVPRLDWATLRRLWHPSLLLSLPFYSSFLAQNTLTFGSIVPDLPTVPIVQREIGQEIPLDELLNEAVDRYVANSGATVQPVKSIYYKNRKDAKNFQIWRCILDRKTYDKPNMDHMCSREFCVESWRELT